jgi:hypothetical protein
MDKIKAVALAAAVWLCWIGAATAQVAYNGTGSTTHSAVTTAYAAGQLFALNTSGNAVASPIVLNSTQPGQQNIDKAIVYSNGTNQPPAIILYLFTTPPFTTGLVDRSAYIGPYAADLAAGIYLGALTCSTWNKTNDGTAQYFAECAGSGLMLNVQPTPSVSGTTTIYALEEINGAYTPLASEKHTYFVQTYRNN